MIIIEIKHIFLALSFAMAYGMCSVATSGINVHTIEGKLKILKRYLVEP